MDVTLCPVNGENWFAVTQLRVRQDQQDFVMDNSFSLAQAAYMPRLYPVAVLCDGAPVGFALYGWDADYPGWSVYRLMVDAKWQGRGIGRRALAQVIDRVRQQPDAPCLYISAEPENAAALKLYESMGFALTGEIIEGEVALKMEFASEEA